MVKKAQKPTVKKKTAVKKVATKSKSNKKPAVAKAQKVSSKAKTKVAVKTKAKPKKSVSKKSSAKKVAPKKTVKKVKATKKPSVAKNKTTKSVANAKKAPAKKVTKKAVPKKSKVTKKSAPRSLEKKTKVYVPKVDELYMDNEQQKHFEKLLLEWKQQLMEEVDRTIQDMREDVSRHPDILDLATQEEEFRLKLRERDRERKLLKKIDDALERLREGAYGFCNDCGAPIGVKRLEARPTATQCIACKSIAELKERQITGG